MLAKEDGSPCKIQQQLAAIESKWQGLLLKPSFPPNQVGRRTHTRVDSSPYGWEQPVGRSEWRKIQSFIPATRTGIAWIRGRASTEEAANERESYEAGRREVLRDRRH